MSKAFTKEDSETDDDGPEPSQPALPSGKNYMTPAGHERLKNELHEILNKTRPETVQVVSWAAGNGDRSENGDYLYGKKKLRELDRRIRFLTKRLESAVVVDPSKTSQDIRTKNKVQFGATVTYENEAGDQKTVQIVGIDESNPATGKISWISPLARVLLNTCLGDAISFHLPKGEEELVIIAVKY